MWGIPVCVAVLVAIVTCWAYRQSRLSNKTYHVAGKTALVTGGSSGLGKQICRALVARGMAVINLDVVESEEKGVRFVKCDVGNESELKRVLDEVRQPLRVVVNNAGIRHNESLLNLKDDKIHALFNINTLSHVWILRAVLPRAIESKHPLSVVTVSSVLGSLGPKNLSVYLATKAAVNQIHELLSVELAPYPWIRPLLVIPGQINTSMFLDAHSNQLLAPLVDSAWLAARIVDKIEAGEKGVFCTPLYANFLWMVKTLPIFLQDILRWFSDMDNQIVDTSSHFGQTT